MTAAPAPSPQQIRDRLLQAIDPQSNVSTALRARGSPTGGARTPSSGRSPAPPPPAEGTPGTAASPPSGPAPRRASTRAPEASAAGGSGQLPAPCCPPVRLPAAPLRPRGSAVSLRFPSGRVPPPPPSPAPSPGAVRLCPAMRRAARRPPHARPRLGYGLQGALGWAAGPRGAPTCSAVPPPSLAADAGPGAAPAFWGRPEGFEGGSGALERLRQRAASVFAFILPCRALMSLSAPSGM